MKRRRFLHQTLTGMGLPAACAILPFSTLTASAEESSNSLNIQRLNWAGVRFSSKRAEVFVDPVITDIWGGNSPHPMVTVEPTEKRRYALITHLHGDHFDRDGLKTLLGERGRVIVSEANAAAVASLGLKVLPAEMFKPLSRRGFTFAAVPAVDGIGDGQVSWVIRHGNQRYFHAGDTIWHGSWRDWGRFYGPFEAAFLPINGAIQADDPPSEVPLSLTPEQAVDATVLLNARQLVPIHYGFNDPGGYDETQNALQRLRSTAERRGVRVQVMTPGDWLKAD